jgi:hypothetical protein
MEKWYPLYTAAMLNYLEPPYRAIAPPPPLKNKYISGQDTLIFFYVYLRDLREIKSCIRAILGK